MSSPIIKLPQVPKDLDPELRDYLLNINKILIGKQNEEYADNGKIKSDIDTINTNFPDNVKSELNATGEAPIYACRAWVNFNGIGTVAIRASGNVSSITDLGVGQFRINFTVAMPDTNYSPINGSDGVMLATNGTVYTLASTGFTFSTTDANGNIADRTYMSVGIIR